MFCAIRGCRFNLKVDSTFLLLCFTSLQIIIGNPALRSECDVAKLLFCLHLFNVLPLHPLRLWMGGQVQISVNLIDLGLLVLEILQENTIQRYVKSPKVIRPCSYKTFFHQKNLRRHPLDFCRGFSLNYAVDFPSVVDTDWPLIYVWTKICGFCCGNRANEQQVTPLPGVQIS